MDDPLPCPAHLGAKTNRDKLRLALKVIEDVLRGQATWNHGSGYAGAGMSARTREIQILIAWMFIAWAEVSQLSQVVA